ncbi:thioredoxin family protein [Bariatricus massiliensis]|uniref:Thioredoxin family protein n=1 Tax=Bariatricus massiliensis TaxID=1745713 RepID=A0ABS8DED6_9FIRM|nr:thioredoxin family protein [Bariatricus massiliensis]MCB7302900.1 thioredoxin family protein [Bariatricus massiliensis]MCB7374116.1 thioredoxin family protein [Bariatricus massiliensis]MCB7386786.1 thioredoxin family protein [Bariatricus massiliensis]MCB7410948.1 thioredoxin family protein [Bariatricus massiliensis]MCQ5251774.1 thioredoxin family protein [Bariatricus massiliensis]
MAVIEATESNFDELVQGAEYVMVDFYGDSCGACVATAPYYREVADDMAFIRFVQVNTSNFRKLAREYKIFGIPAFKYFHNGKLVHESVGGMEAEQIYANLAELLYHDVEVEK